MHKILVIDDNHQYIRIYKDFFADEGFEVLGATKIEVAFDTLDKNKDIQAVILDYSMPGVDNEAVLRTLKSDHPQLKIVISSCYPVEYQQRMVKEVAGYHDKCSGLDTLLANIKKALFNGEAKA